MRQLSTGEDVRKLRSSLGLSRSQFCSRFGINVLTLRDWEQGRRLPNGIASVLLAVIAAFPDKVREVAEEGGKNKAAAKV